MAPKNPLVGLIMTFVILFKYWFRTFKDLITGGPALKNLGSETVLITGAASGLGKCIAQRLAPLGCRLVLWDVDETNLTLLAADLNKLTNSKRVYSMKVDLTSRENIYASAQKVKDEVGNVTVIFNNAGVVSGKPLVNCSDAQIQRTFDVNVIAHFWVLKSFLPSMLERNHGHIITVASAAGLGGASGLVDYCSSKFAAVGLHEALTHELYALKKFGVKTTVVCPSFMNTGMFEGARGTDVAPILNYETVTDEVIKGVRQDKHLILLPKSLYFPNILSRIAPRGAELEIHEMMDLHKAMDTFVGREKKAT